MVVAMEVDQVVVEEAAVVMEVALAVDGFKLKGLSALGEESERGDRADAGLRP